MTDERRATQEQILKNPRAYLIIGDLDKPYHLCECECGMCEDWRKTQGRPTHEEIRRAQGNLQQDDNQ